MPTVTVEQLVTCLTLAEVSPGNFEGSNLPLEYHRIFGGQLLAQTLVAAASGAEGKTAKSIHMVFCREGDATKPITYEVAAHQDGRTFATRAVTGRQGDRVVCTAAVSLHQPDESTFEQQSARGPGGNPEDAKPVDLGMIPFDTRIAGGVDLGSTASEPAELVTWMRADDLPTDQLVHQALLAHSTDLTLIGTALRPLEGVSQSDAHVTLQTAVTSHTMWFHRPVDLNAWTVLDQRVPSLHAGRAFGTGNVFDAQGGMVASYAQESMIRPARAQ